MSVEQITTSPNSGQRIASPQAWRRLWKHVTRHELDDIALDVAAYVEWSTDSPLSIRQIAAIREALSSYPWDVKKQAV